MAVYLARHNIQVNAISPGGFPLAEDENDQFQQRYRERTPLGRMGRADDLKGAVVYFASHASDYVTGQNLMVDGGWTAW
jgi:gluconate 5-dehydrogenase